MTQRKTRLSTRVKAAVDLMVHEGQKRDDAADSVGLHRDSLRKAFKRPDVLAYRTEQMDLLRSSAAAGTISQAERLMRTAESEHVQLDATKWLAGLDGLAPVSRQEIEHRHTGMAPGLVINLVAAHPQPAVIEVSARPAAVTAPKHDGAGRALPARVPHPSERAE